MQNSAFDTTDLTWLARLAQALLHESHAADDLVQETMVAALEGPMPATARPRAWLGSVARRLAARRYRGEARRTRREERVARPEALPDSAELVERAEAAAHVNAATRALPEPFRRTVLLHFREGRTAEEISRQEGKPADTVRWRLRRGLALMREELMQRGDRNWSSWCLVLAPLAASIASPSQAAALATGSALTSGSALSSGASTSFLAFVATAKSKWLVAAALIVLAGSGLWFVWKTNPWEPQRVVSSAGDEADEIEPPFSSTPEPDGARTEAIVAVAPTSADEPANDERPAEEASATTVDTPRGIFGRVVDATERPVAGATIYLVPSANGDAQARGANEPEVLARTETDDQGKFVLAPDSWESSGRTDLPPPDLGVVANGFLREVVVDPLRRQGADGLLVVLESGRTLSGRVLDESGYPVPGLSVLAHTADAGVDHVSPSQSRMRADRSELGDAHSQYHHCHGRTDDNGEVVFTGLPDGELVVRSLDPAWKIDDPRLVRADGSYVTWHAKPQLGVRLFVVDASTGLPVDHASARFSLKVTFADGAEDDYSQWVGRGNNGTVSFAFVPDLVALGDRVITEATFYGTVKYGDVRTKWEAEPIVDAWGASGIAEVRVEVDTAAPAPMVENAQLAESAAGGTPTEVPATELELQVGYADGTTFDGRLVVAWTSRDEDSEVTREGQIRPESWAPGQYRMTIPAGDVSLQVHEFGASGSLSPWTGEVRCDPNGLTTAVVTLQRGGTVTIERPHGWTGNWQLHASWRMNDLDPWSGSWNYGTPEDTLTLSALMPAEWRFQLRRGTERDAEPIIRTIFVNEGDELVVER